jgi:hypothetical protein
MHKTAGLSADAQPDTVAAHPSPRSSQPITPSSRPDVNGRTPIRNGRVAIDVAFIAEAAAVERLRQEPDRRVEYLLRRANLLTCLAEQTGSIEDRALAEKAWESLRALTRDLGRPGR